MPNRSLSGAGRCEGRIFAFQHAQKKSSPYHLMFSGADMLVKPVGDPKLIRGRKLLGVMRIDRTQITALVRLAKRDHWSRLAVVL